MLGLVLGPHRLGMALMIISSALCWSARCPTLALTCTLTPTLTRTATLTLARSCLLYWPTNYQQFAVLLPCCTFYWGWASNHVDSTPDVPGGRGPSGCLAEGRGRGRGRGRVRVPVCRDKEQGGSGLGQL